MPEPSGEAGAVTVVVDYGRGNLFSLGQALHHLGAAFEISDDPERVAGAESIIFPGVGAFGDAMAGLEQRGLVEPLRQAAAAGVPILGICVGCQLLMSRGEEFGEHAGLDIIQGTVSKLAEPDAADESATRVPNVGWREIDVRTDDPVVGPLADGEMVYFVHSYAPVVDDEANAIGWLNINGTRTAIAVRRGNIFGVQFHPEKSGPTGLALLDRFLKIAQ